MKPKTKCDTIFLGLHPPTPTRLLSPFLYKMIRITAIIDISINNVLLAIIHLS